MIEFPGLGLQFDINPIALQFGNIKIFWYGIIIAFGFMLAVFLTMRRSRDFGIDSENVIDLVLIAAPVAIITARLYYVAFEWENYVSDPLEIVKIWHGGIAIYGAILGALAAAYFFARHKKINPLRLFDLGAPYLLMAQGIGRWGNFVNQEAFGVNTKLPWGMTSATIQKELERLQRSGMDVDPSLPVHPTFLYESIWNLLGFAALIIFRKHRKVDGDVFFLYMIIYGAGRFWIEGLRTDSLMMGNLRVSQVLAFVFVLAFSIVFYIRRKKAAEGNLDERVIGTSEYGDVLKKLNEEEAEKEKPELKAEADYETGAIDVEESGQEAPEKQE